MKVLGFGFPRTGTSSFKRALEILLDQPVYHSKTDFSFLALARYPLIAMRYTRRWLDIHLISLARIENPASYTVSEAQRQKYLLAQQFEGFAAITDAPVNAYVREIRELYPDAMVIVTTRDEDKWLQSTESIDRLAPRTGGYVLFLRLVLWPLPGMQNAMQAFSVLQRGRWKELYYTQGEVKDGTYVYRRHMEYLRRELGDEIHFYNVKDGWGPLCEILGVAVPETPFPHLNDAEAMARSVGRMIRAGLLVWAGIIIVMVGLTSWVWKLAPHVLAMLAMATWTSA